MWLGLLWVVTMFLALFTTFSFSSMYLHALMWILFAIAILLTQRSKRRVAYTWFVAVSLLCIFYDAYRLIR